MKIYWGLNSKVQGDYSIAIGAFDGIHKGHQMITKTAIAKAKKSKLLSGIVTFNPHPQKVISGRVDSLILLPLEDKIRYFHKLGVDALFLIDFNETLSGYSPEKFIKFLTDYINIKFIYVGFNFHFGYKCEGNVQKLSEFGDRFNFNVNIIPPVKFQEMVISSTLIRTLIRDGKVELASKMLGHLYFVSGDVIKGHGRGNELGFSTANIRPDNEVIPKDGVYATIIQIDKSTFYGVTNIGNCPTFQNESKSIEVNIFDYNQEIYGKWIKIYFVQWLRPEQKFKTIQDLMIQVKKDSSLAKEIFKKKHKPLEIK